MSIASRIRRLERAFDPGERLKTARDCALEAHGLPNDRPGWGSEGWTRARYRRGLERMRAAGERHERDRERREREDAAWRARQSDQGADTTGTGATD